MPTETTSRKGVLTIAAGPLYVDFRTKMTFSPTSATHTELVHPDSQWQRAIGGSVWKMALHCAKQAKANMPVGSDQGSGKEHQPDKFVVVSSFAKQLTKDVNGPPPQSPFADDAFWLMHSIRAEVDVDSKTDRKRVASEPLEVVFNHPTKPVLTDYTFHMEHPSWKPWPILTIRGGAAHELQWKHVLAEWKTQTERAEYGRYQHKIVVLTGVLRTQLLETLADTLNQAATQELLDQAKLVIDFGRTARSVHGMAATKELQDEVKRYREIVQRCVTQAHVVLADEHTAEQFELRQLEYLPKQALVIRQSLQGEVKQSATHETWWQFQAKSRPGAHVSYGHFQAPRVQKPKGNQGGAGESGDNRPARDIALARSLCLGESRYRPKTWSQYMDPRRPRTPEDITQCESLQRALRELQVLVEAEAISTLFIHGETGTGKEIVSRWVHSIHPTYSSGELHAVSCGRQRGELVQSELFGHVEGAFTHAIHKRQGAFVAANGGVLVLDDLDSLDEVTQAMLLRVIESRLVQPVGSDFDRPVDLLLIVTTNVAPKELMQRSRERRQHGGSDLSGLREDLFYRFLDSGEFLFLPPLRERTKDVLHNARKMWDEQNQIFAQNFKFPDVLETLLKKSDLVGNFRLLRAAVKKTFRATLAADSIQSGRPPEVPQDVERWLDEKANVGTADGEIRLPVAVTSNLYHWLQKNDYLEKLTSREVVCEWDALVDYFVELWALARKKDQDGYAIEAALSLNEIKACVMSPIDPPGSEKKLIKALKDKGIIPDRTGRGATWKPDWRAISQ
ncbi:MAG TPA: sigma 54-interacting transcriptional regulator [Pirellulaceae bacterium]|nr:sigma 54-interacting transcriptional regulator [Pirellulaceae bacterium]